MGNEHPNTAKSYNNLASFYQTVQQKHDKAEEYYEKSLQIRKKVLHSDTATLLSFALPDCQGGKVLCAYKYKRKCWGMSIQVQRHRTAN